MLGRDLAGLGASVEPSPPTPCEEAAGLASLQVAAPHSSWRLGSEGRQQSAPVSSPGGDLAGFVASVPPTPQGSTPRPSSVVALCQANNSWCILDDAAGPASPRGPAIDVFINFSGGRCRGSRQHPQGPAIDVFINFSGGHCRGSRQHPPGGPPSTSLSNMTVAAAGAYGSQGAHHRCLRDVVGAPRLWHHLPGGPLSTSCSYVVDVPQILLTPTKGPLR
jgi:hypothetical protein